MNFPDFIDAQNPIFLTFILLSFLAVVIYVIKSYQFQPLKIKNKKRFSEYEKKTKELSRNIELNVEKEKDRISKELHDSICQELLLIKLKLNKSYDTKESVTLETIQQTDAALKKTRNLAYELRPFELDKNTIIDLIYNLCNRITENTDLKYEFSHSNNLENISESININLFRIIQEATKNIVLHSEAQNFSIELFYSDNEVVLIISDNGKGFTVDKLPDGRINSNRLGLIGIQERVNNFGGSFEVDSTKGKGATLVIEIPTEEGKIEK